MCASMRVSRRSVSHKEILSRRNLERLVNCKTKILRNSEREIVTMRVLVVEF